MLGNKIEQSSINTVRVYDVIRGQWRYFTLDPPTVLFKAQCANGLHQFDYQSYKCACQEYRLDDG